VRGIRCAAVHPDFPPASAPLEVDRVEWIPASPESVHVHVYGRWIDRPVAEPLVLLVGTERRRHPFDALEPPPAGVLVAFAVPNELRSRLSVDIALQIGSHELALPAASTGPFREAGADEDEAEGEVIDRAVLAERRARRAELAEEALTRRAVEAEQTAGTLEAQLANLEERLATARDERDELEAGLADAESRLRTAQQHRFAEQQLRIEAQDELERLRRGEDGQVAELRGRLAAANQRAEDLAREVDAARRGMAEALQQAEADRAALRRVEGELQARIDSEGRPAVREIEAELRTALEAERQAFDRQVAGVERHIAGVREQALAAAGRLREALDAERAAREAAERELAEGRELVATERTAASEAIAGLALEQSRRAALEAQVADALAAVRTVRAEEEARATRDGEVRRLVGEILDTAASLRDAFERESRKLERELTARVSDERGQMAAELEALDARAAGLQAEVLSTGERLEQQLVAERAARELAEAELARRRERAAAADIEPGRAEAGGVIADLTTAAERLREQAPALPDEDAEDEEAAAVEIAPVALQPRIVPAAQRGAEPWLSGSIARLSAADPEVAGRLVLALLPLQRLRAVADVVYDVTVTGLGSFRVSVRAAQATVEPVAEPGGAEFHVAGTAAELAGFAAGGIDRRPPKSILVRGSRRRLKRLTKRLREPMQLSDVARAGAVSEPGLILAALAAGVDPEWTAGHRFTVAWVVEGAHGGTWTIAAGDGALQVRTGLPADGPRAAVHVPQPVFVPLLAGFAAPPGLQATAEGDAHAVDLLRQWFDRVQRLA
jgi:hypothetical protein